MSYPNPYGGPAPGVGYPQPRASAYPAPGAGTRLGFESVPPYASTAPSGYGSPAPGFNTSGSGYPQQPSGAYPPAGGAYPPSTGYPQQYGGGQPNAYPPQSDAYGRPPLAYPQGGGSYGQPSPSAYPSPGQCPPSGGQYPPSGGQYPPSGGQYPPSGGQYPPSGGQHPPAGGQYPAPGGQYGYGPPAGGQPPYGAPGVAQPPYGSSTAPSTMPTLSYGTGGSGPGAPYQGPPAPGYGSPAPGYGAPEQGPGGPTSGYGGGYCAPGSGYCAPGGGYGGQHVTTAGYGASSNPTPIMAYNSTHFQGTVKPSPSFNPNADCESLKKAMKGFGCDEKAVINVLCFRSNAQRQQIRHSFKTMYGKDLVKELISELRGNFEDLVVALMYTPGEYDARELRHAMEGAGTVESTLIEILATRTNAEIRDIKFAYRAMFGKDLEHSLVSETSGYFKRLLVSLCNAGRDESMHVDPARAKKSAQDLYQAGVKRWGTDEATFNAVLCSQNYGQLQAVFEEYRKMAGHDIEQAIKSEFSGDVETGLLAVVQSAKNAPAFFAARSYNSMVGMGTNDRALIRSVVTRCEKDMVQIKQEFQRIYGKTMESFISGDASGKYKDGLFALVRGN